jgi:hypothetical protein
MTDATAALIGAVLVAGALAAQPARAEHMTLVPPSEQTSEGPAAPSIEGARERAAAPSDRLDLDVSLGRDGFRLGARFFGASGVWGAWLNGQTRPDGFELDGRVQQPTRGYGFTINAEIDAWARRALDRIVRP